MKKKITIDWWLDKLIKCTTNYAYGVRDRDYARMIAYIEVRISKMVR